MPKKTKTLRLIVGDILSRLRPTTETEAAYAAGLIDGEGCISIHYRSGRHYNGSPYRFIQLRIMVTNTNLAVLHWLHRKFGFHVYTTQPVDSKRHKASGHAELASERAAEFLRTIRPYLIIKRKHATLGLLVHNRIHHQWVQRSQIGGKGRGLTAGEKAWRDRAVELFHGLNRKGPPKHK